MRTFCHMSPRNPIRYAEGGRGWPVLLRRFLVSGEYEVKTYKREMGMKRSVSVIGFSEGPGP